MRQFIKEILSENGSGSTKRAAFWVLLFAFLAQCAVNLFWAKELSPTLRDQLYYAMLGALSVIFGVNIAQIVKDIKTTQSNNNASVGAPSPPPAPADTTIVK